MALATASRSGLVEQVIEQLRVEIRSGGLPLGERIPTEGELATTFGVGRNTVREAVRALAHAGLLDVRQGDGTFVHATTELSGALRKLPGAELREVLELRRVLEVESARLAATRRTAGELAELRKTLRRRDSALGEARIDVAVHADAEFHRLIVQAAHNSLLGELYYGVTEAVFASVATTMDPGAGAAKSVSHTDLLAAIAGADAVRAAAEAAGFLNELLSNHPAAARQEWWGSST
jgi:DNA-binding FadR family transcriptional regulator